jgi:hypothetical protein
MFKGEIITSTIIFIGSLILYWETLKFEGHEVYAKLGPSYWPKFLLILLMGLSVGVAVDAFRERKKGEGKESILKLDKGRLKFFIAMGFIALYFILLQIIGFILLTPFFLIAFMYLLGERKKIWMISISFGITLLIIYVFTKAMYVPLPRGIGIFLDFSHLFY